MHPFLQMGKLRFGHKENTGRAAEGGLTSCLITGSLLAELREMLMVMVMVSSNSSLMPDLWGS